MEALDLGGLLEWIQGFVEERCGKFWAWVVYFGLLAAVVGGTIWFLYHLKHSIS